MKNKTKMWYDCDEFGREHPRWGEIGLAGP
jgi:hypothetical protein